MEKHSPPDLHVHYEGMGTGFVNRVYTILSASISFRKSLLLLGLGYDSSLNCLLTHPGYG